MRKPVLRKEGGLWACRVPFRPFWPVGYGVTPVAAYDDWQRWIQHFTLTGIRHP